VIATIKMVAIMMDAKRAANIWQWKMAANTDVFSV
jgi:hypothetical protein